MGDDLREGKPTLPLIHVMARGLPAERDLVRSAIANPESASFADVIAAITRTGAMDYTMAAARNECELARRALDVIGPSPFRQALADLLEFVVQRRS